MSTYLVIEWSAPEAHGHETELAMTAVRAHVLVEHPEIRSVRLLRQFAGPLPHVAYRWEEEYADLTAIDELIDSPDCAAVWIPVNRLAVPGSQRQSIWSDIEPTSRIRPFAEEAAEATSGPGPITTHPHVTGSTTERPETAHPDTDGPEGGDPRAGR